MKITSEKLAHITIALFAISFLFGFYFIATLVMDAFEMHTDFSGHALSFFVLFCILATIVAGWQEICADREWDALMKAL